MEQLVAIAALSTGGNFARLLRKGGHQTAINGKWHLDSEPQGSAHWEGFPGRGIYSKPDLKKQNLRVQKIEADQMCPQQER